MTRAMLCLALASLAPMATARTQAAPNTTVSVVAWTALKNRLPPDSALKPQIDSIDAAIVRARRSGQNTEVRRLVAKGTALLNHRPWTDADDFRASLVLRTEHLFVDPSRPWTVRLEQFYAPDISLPAPLTARAVLRRLGIPASAEPRVMGEFADIGRDFRDRPLRMELDLTGVADASYVLDVSVSDSTRSLGNAILPVTVVSGMDARFAALEAAAAKAPEDIRADLRYPADYVRKIDRGTIGTSGFVLANELPAAESLAIVVKKNKTPFNGRTGGFERHYMLDSAKEIMPYRVYVPTKYVKGTPMPLIIALHGLGGTEDGFMDNYERLLPTLAEQRGYLVATPLGFRIDGGYGSPIMGTGRDARMSELDVMQVLARMLGSYSVDPQRVYLMGHSMGGIGTWHLGAKYANLWAAIASFAGMGYPAAEEAMKALPQFVVHGDADGTVNVAGSRRMVEAMKALGVDYQYIEVPGGSHNGVVVPNLPAMFDFFDKRKKAIQPVGTP